MRLFALLSIIGTVTIAQMPGAAPVIPGAAAAEIPGAYVTRAEAAMILLKNSDIQIDMQARAQGQYPDIINGEWYVPYMLTGVRKGLFKADPDTGHLYPHRGVSAGEFLMMLQRTFNLQRNLPHRYADVPGTHPASPYAGLSWKYALFTNPDNPQLLRPNARITHAKAAQAVFTLFAKEPALRPTPKKIPAVRIHFAAPGAQNTFFHDLKTAVRSFMRSEESLAAQTRNDLIAAVNSVRAKYKLQPLTTNYYLELAAQNHAKDMAVRGYFSHYTPEGLSYIDRIRASGYLRVTPEECGCVSQFSLDVPVRERGPDYIIHGDKKCGCQPSFSLGENLARGQLSVKQVMTDWLNSENHRKNILRPEFEEIGFGLFDDVWVQEFGRVQVGN